MPGSTFILRFSNVTPDSAAGPLVMIRTFDDFMLTPRRIALLIAVALVLVACVVFREQLNLRNLHAHAHEMNPAMVVFCLFTLPLLGFPVSVMHAVTGAKFG